MQWRVRFTLAGRANIRHAVLPPQEARANDRQADS